MSLEFQKRIVVFIDILGFAALVTEAAKNPAGDTAKRLSTGLTIIQNLQLHQKDKVAHKKSTLKDPYAGSDLRLQIFSDSVILSIIPSPGGMSRLVEQLSILFVRLMQHGIYIRGGISHDLININGNSPCGPAVNTAYYTEANIAITPRIALSKSAVEYCRREAQNIIDGPMLKRDERDGVWLVEVLETGIRHGISDKETFGSDVQRNLNNALSAIVDSPKNFAKMKALAEQWNWMCRSNNDQKPFSGEYRTKGGLLPNKWSKI